MATKNTKSQTKKNKSSAVKPAARTTGAMAGSAQEAAAGAAEEAKTAAAAAPKGKKPGKAAAAKGKAAAKKTAASPEKKPAEAPAVKVQAAPAVKEPAEAPAVKEEAKAPAVKEQAAPAVKEQAEAPAVKEEPKAPAVKGQAAPAVKEPAEAPAAKEEPKAAAEPEKTAPAKDGAIAAKILLKPNKDGSKITAVAPRPEIKGNPYKPMVCTVLEVIRETANIKTFRVGIDDPEVAKNFHFEPGQVGQLSVFGTGESTFVINTPPSVKDYLQFSVMMAGEVTTAIHNLSKGDKVGVRAPLGRPFPYDLWKGKDLFFIGGGIGMAPIRTIMMHCLEHKQDYGTISLLYGARSPQDLTYQYELDSWMANPDLNCTLTIDREAEGWPHKVGMIPNVLREIAPKADNCVAVLCGPPIMIKFTLMALDELGFSHENVYTTLEKRMKCGIGICGRCGIGGKYVCLDGPVFSQKELDELPPEL